MYMRFKEQESIDVLVYEATDLLLRVGKMENRDPVNVDWDDVSAMLYKTRCCLTDANDYALHLQGWAKTGQKGNLKEIL